MSDDKQPSTIKVVIADQSAITNSAITVTAAGGDLHYHALPPERPLRQLPAPLRDFLDRTEEREHLILALGIPAGRTAAIATIQGMGGVGKTVLAVAVANELAPGYPDGQLVVAMQAGSGAPRSTADGLREIVQLFHPPEQVLPEDLDALSALYCGYLGGKRVLIVLDDVRDTATARAFVPPAGCGLLITSRQSITLDGHDATIRLLPFTDEARTLLLQLAPRLAHEPEVEQLLHLAREGRCNLPRSSRRS